MSTLAQTSSGAKPFTSDDTGWPVQVHSLDLDRYLHEDFYARLDQITDQSSLPRDIDEAHRRALAKRLRNYDYDED